LAFWFALAAAWPAPAASAAEPKVDVILEGLSNPFALAVQPRTDKLFVANSGAGEVLLIDPAKKTGLPVVTGIPTVLGGPGDLFRVGPLGLGFDGPTSLIVSGPAAKDDSPLQVFSIAKEPAAVAWQTSDSGELLLSQAWRVAAAGGAGLVATARGIDGSIQLWPFRKAAKSEDFVSSAPLGGGTALWALASTPRAELVAAAAGDLGGARDSRIFFVGGRSGKVLMSAAVELRDIIDLAYSPKTGRLFAADFSAATPESGGIFRLDAAADGKVNPVRVVTMERPTALAFASNGDLLFTQLAGPPSSEGKAAGRLGRLANGWEDKLPNR